MVQRKLSSRGGAGGVGECGAEEGGAIPDLFGGQESCGRMESAVFAHKPTQKPGHCSEGNINSLGGSWKFNSGKTEHMLLISWLPWPTIAWQSEEATKTTALNSDQQGSEKHLRRK